jgi:hypothetical protein
VFRTSGSAPWFGQTAVHDGDGDAARSAPPGNGGAALLTTQVEGPGRLSWRWRVDSERDRDLLTTTVDGVEVQRASGRTGFARRAERIDTPGAHEITWQYAKDASGHSGADAVWLDRVLWQPGTGSVVRDFDGDGDADALIRHADGRWRLFELERGERVSDSSPRLFADPAWQLDAIADFDDDGDADILLVNPAAGARRLFTMERLAVAGSHWLPLPATGEWRVVGAGDADADGNADLVLHHTDPQSGRHDYRIVPFAGGLPLEPRRAALWGSSVWQYRGAADLDGNGAVELLLQHTTSGRWRAFDAAGGDGVESCNVALFRGADWSLAGSGDFDGDGDADALLRHSDGWWRLFTADQGIVTRDETPVLPTDPAWRLMAADGDLDGDGDADIVIRHASLGYWRWIEMQEGQVVGNHPLALWRDPAWVWQ